jgi:hypothetical protein
MIRPTEIELFGARAFLRYLGAPETREMQTAVVAWFRQESGSVAKVIGNNPFNIKAGSASYLSVGERRGGFLMFPSLARGFKAAAIVIEDLAPSYGYGTVILAALSGNPLRFLGALANSAWSESHYGVQNRAFPMGMDNHLVVVYRELMA